MLWGDSLTSAGLTHVPNDVDESDAHLKEQRNVECRILV